MLTLAVIALAVKEIGIIEIKEQAGIAIQMSYAQYQEYSNFLKEYNLMELDNKLYRSSRYDDLC